jgi:hypothetical protein
VTALRLVDEQGEIHPPDDCPGCQAKEHELEELTRKMRGMARELGELRRDKDREAREHEAWPTILALFDYWREQTGHAKARWTGDRFWIALPLWKEWGAGNMAAAIAGIAFDPNRKPMRNGKIEVYDDWETVFKNSGNLRRYAARRPPDWTLPEQFAGQNDERPAGKGEAQSATVARPSKVVASG